ncbi:hypothetical protein [Neisseria sicca]|uniref:hypothetical protein n=1 Tax=Neisseria sicca TaxID=490 RepID=UPI001649DA64|nr:hypothetical protein [Neisseria sicca]
MKVGNGNGNVLNYPRTGRIGKGGICLHLICVSGSVDTKGRLKTVYRVSDDLL